MKPIYPPGSYMVRYYDSDDNKIHSELSNKSFMETKHEAQFAMAELNAASFKVLHVIHDSKYNVHSSK